MQIDDFKKLHSKVSSAKATVAIIGGGFLGSELACALARKGDLSSRHMSTYFLPVSLYIRSHLYSRFAPLFLYNGYPHNELCL